MFPQLRNNYNINMVEFLTMALIALLKVKKNENITSP